MQSLGAARREAQAPGLVGSWRGTASNGYSFAYAFQPNGTFTWWHVGSSGSTLLAQGSFRASANTLVLDGTFRGAEGELYRTRVELSAYMTDSMLCDSAFTSERHDGAVGRWTNVTTVQSLDADDMPPRCRGDEWGDFDPFVGPERGAASRYSARC